jgi:hypothetical protein
LEIQDIPAATTNRVVEIHQPVTETKFYRLAVP